MLALDKLQPEFYKSLGVDQSDHNMVAGAGKGEAWR